MGLRKGMVLVGKYFNQKTVIVAANTWYKNAPYVTECQGERGYVVMVPKRYVRANAEWHRASRILSEGMIKS